MKRRTFIAALGGAAAWPVVALAEQQQPKVWRIGLLETISADLNAANLGSFQQSMRHLGYVEGQNLVIEYRSADGDANRFSGLVAELIHLNVDLIVTRGTPAALAAKNATSTIPIVMASTGEPLLVVASLARPGGNITGLSSEPGFDPQTSRVADRAGSRAGEHRSLYEHEQSCNLFRGIEGVRSRRSVQRIAPSAVRRATR